mgnify:CR=1 FL=1
MAHDISHIRTAADADAATIAGHPSQTIVSRDASTFEVSVCAECGSLRSILWLLGDRWYCRTCRSSGEGRPTAIPVTNPSRNRSRRHG